MGIRGVDSRRTVDLCGIVVMKMPCELSRIDSLVNWIDLMSKHGSSLLNVVSRMNRIHQLVNRIELMHMVKRISLMSLMLVDVHLRIMNRTAGLMSSRAAGLMNSMGRVCVR